jgi:hypothetical protein
MKYPLIAVILASAFAFCAHAEDGEKMDQPVELGTVKWLRDLDKAVANSTEQQKPIAILFQEVPG